MRLLLVWLVLMGGLCGLTPAARADAAAETALQRTLDTAINLDLEKVDLPKAFDAIASRAKIRIQVDQACYDALPYGDTTKVTIKFDRSPLRAGLDELLSPLGLEDATSGGVVVIRPSAPLKRIGRRAEWEELSLLRTLTTTQLARLDTDWTADLRTLLGKPELVVQNSAEAAANEKAMAAVRAQLPTTVAAALDTYAAGTGQIWTVNGGNVVIVPLKKWMERQLDRPIIINKSNAPLGEVVAELAALSRLRIQPEPGLYAAVPTVSLNSNNGTVRQTLDALSGATGIAYDVREDAVYLQLGDKPGTNPAPRADAIVGRIVLPLGGGSAGGADDANFDMFIRESDLPPELNALRKRRIAQAIAELQNRLKDPPATAPATQPTTAPVAGSQ